MTVGLYRTSPMEKKRVRPWLKRIRLPGGEKTDEVIGILKAWRDAKETPKHFVAAIRIYAALLRADTSVLEEYFPWAGSNNSFGMRRPAKAPAAVTIEETSVTASADDLLDALGIDKLEM